MIDILQLIGGAILAVGYIPQILQLAQTRSAKDISLKTYLALLAGIGLMEAYAIDLVISGSGTMFLVTNTTSFVMVSIVVMEILTLRGRHRLATKPGNTCLYCRGIRHDNGEWVYGYYLNGSNMCPGWELICPKQTTSMRMDDEDNGFLAGPYYFIRPGTVEPWPAPSTTAAAGEADRDVNDAV